MTSALPPASRMACAVESRVDWVRPQRTAVAPRAASLRAMAAPIPRPAPVITATCPTRGCPVSIGRGSPANRWGGNGMETIHVVHQMHLSNSNKVEDGWELACLRLGRYL